MRRISCPALLVMLLPFTGMAAQPEKDAAALIARIKAVKNEGEGNAEAAAAWKQLVALGNDALLPTLGAMTERGVVANNWLRSAVDAMTEKGNLPAKELEAFIKDRKNNGVGRSLAFELLTRADKTAPERLLPDMLDETSGELRREAVAALIKAGDAKLEKKENEAAQLDYKKAFDAARDTDQVDALAAKLNKMGVKVDVTGHYGCILHWNIIGPFDNTAGVGFAATYPPEKGIELTKSYKGKNGTDVRWTPHTTESVRGLVNLNKIYEGKLKGVIAYAHVTIDSPTEQKVNLRAGTKNAVKFFLNGKQVFSREEYHHTVTALDNHIAEGVLKKGRNEILMKICQNEQKEAYTEPWEFLLRICDDLGGSVPFTIVSPEKKKEGQ